MYYSLSSQADENINSDYWRAHPGLTINPSSIFIYLFYNPSYIQNASNICTYTIHPQSIHHTSIHPSNIHLSIHPTFFNSSIHHSSYCLSILNKSCTISTFIFYHPSRIHQIIYSSTIHTFTILQNHEYTKETVYQKDHFADQASFKYLPLIFSRSQHNIRSMIKLVHTIYDTLTMQNLKL